MSTLDYIPSNDGKFLTWEKNLFTYTKAHADAWQIKPATWGVIDQQSAAYEAAWTKAQDPNRGKADTLAKNEARDALKKSIREYVKEYLENSHFVTDEDRKHMGLPVHDTTRTPSPSPTTTLETESKTPSPAVVEIHYRDAKSESKAKPAGVHGAEVAWAVLDHHPEDWEELTHSLFCTRTPAILTFGGRDRGKTLYYALRWENTRGVKGPWTEIFQTIIP
ncbi:MAG: hypothetical protein LBM08_01385 [Dysgonamonadaceae bacterium]|jgi:hypothetical protein|nr:hypothetical protein [Dysgonamonadaceae bacterium]